MGVLSQNQIETLAIIKDRIDLVESVYLDNNHRLRIPKHISSLYIELEDIRKLLNGLYEEDE